MAVSWWRRLLMPPCRRCGHKHPRGHRCTDLVPAPWDNTITGGFWEECQCTEGRDA